MEVAFNFLKGPGLILSFIAFILLSYIILGLLTWSFVKPLKYLGVTCVITGVITLTLKGGVYLTVNYFAKDELELFKPFLDECGNLFAILGAIFIASGIILIIIYKVISHFQQKNLENKEDEDSLKKENKTKKEENLS